MWNEHLKNITASHSICNRVDDSMHLEYYSGARALLSTTQQIPKKHVFILGSDSKQEIN